MKQSDTECLFSVVQKVERTMMQTDVEVLFFSVVQKGAECIPRRARWSTCFATASSSTRCVRSYTMPVRKNTECDVVDALLVDALLGPALSPRARAPSSL